MAVSGYFEPPASARGGVTIPRIWITVALSILLHALLLWQVNPQLRKPSDDAALTPGEAKGPLNIIILPPARPRAPPLAQRREPAPPAPPPRPIPRQAPAPKAMRPPPPPPPPVIARNTPAPEAPLRVPAERPAPPPPPPAPRDDFAAALEARRRARGEALPAAPPAPPAAPAAPAAESPNERANRLAALNLGTNKTPSYGKRMPGGGVFQIETQSYDYARYAFYGWNKDIRRNALQHIEVRKGNTSDIRVAIVRSMIDIIRRDFDEADFTWENRFGKIETLSARKRDQAGLEAYLLKEFFWDDRRPIGQ